MRYEVWGLHPASLIGTFESEADALDEVRGLLDAGWDARDLSLGRIGPSTDGYVAEGDALLVLLASGGAGQASRSA